MIGKAIGVVGLELLVDALARIVGHRLFDHDFVIRRFPACLEFAPQTIVIGDAGEYIQLTAADALFGRDRAARAADGVAELLCR